MAKKQGFKQGKKIFLKSALFEPLMAFFLLLKNKQRLI
jgi:hypothetical protein